MPDTRDQPDDLFEIEPVEQLDGTPAPPRRRLWRAWRQWVPGMIALVEGLALLALFWLAPWFSWRVLAFTTGYLHNTPVLIYYYRSLLSNHAYSAWSMGQGISVDDVQLTPLIPLWLIPLAAGGLLILAGFSLRQRVSVRLLFNTLLTLSALCLLVEFGLYLQVQTFQANLGNQVAANISWGFWGAAVVTVVALVVGAQQRWPAHTRLPVLATEQH